MKHRTINPEHTGPAWRAGRRAETPSWAVRLVKVSSGVAEGRTSTGRGSAETECWSLFMDPAQVQACATTDPLRFENPILFAQLYREFDHVFARTDPGDLHPGALESPGLCQARP